MKKLLLSVLTLSSLVGFSQWQTTTNNSGNDVFSAFGGVYASDVYSSTGLYSSADNGGNWTFSNIGIPTSGVRFGTLNLGTLYVFGTNANTIYQSSTGNNWTLMSSAMAITDVIKSMAVISGTVLAATCPVSGNSFKIWKLVGSSWTLQSSFTGTLVTCIRNLNGSLFAGTANNNVIKSNDGGITFTNSSVGQPTTTFDRYINCLGATSTAIFSGSQNGKICKSVNAGASWTNTLNIGNGSNSININDIYVMSNNNILVACDSGFVYSQDNGVTWLKDNAGLNYPNYEYLMTRITVVGSYIVASVKTMSNARVMRRPINEIFSGIKESDITSVQSKVYPNPANGNVTIEAGDLLWESKCEVKINDILGREAGVYKMDEGKAFINLENFNQGLYSYRVYNNNTPVGGGKLVVN